MSDTLHTPGPWITDEGDEYGTYKIYYKRESGHLLKLAETSTVLDGGQKANASLIAATPELLEALEMLLADVVAMSDKYQMSIRPHSAGVAQTAITKAKGETNDNLT